MTNKRTDRPTLSKFDFKSAINKANNALLICKAGLQQLDHVQPFGSNLRNLSHIDAANSLVVNRFVSKMYDPEVNNSGLRDAAFAAYISYEETHLKMVSNRFNLWEPSSVGLHVRKARALLHRWFDDFEVDLQNDPLEFTSGESFISQSGDTLLLAKLSNREHWTTTEACLPDTLRLIYGCVSLKRAAKELIGHVSRRERIELYALAHRQGYENDPGFYVFSILLQERLLTVVDGARGSTVPKNVEKDRFINVEATFPMILQRLVARGIKKVLRKCGNFLSPIDKLDPQALHGLLIARSSMATIDFSNASDSVLLRVVKALFPPNFLRYVCNYRSQAVQLGSKWVEPLKLSSMGNGFTFETMTAMLYAVCCTYDHSTSRVYGDDVIIPNSCANAFIKTCSYIGFETNLKKTFVNSKFRESCGKFYHDDFGYLLSYDIHPCKSFQDVIINHNKLYDIIHHGNVDYIVKSYLLRCMKEIRRAARASHIGPVPLSETLRKKNLSLYMWDRNARRKQLANSHCRANYALLVDKSKSFVADMQWDISSYCVCTIPFYVSRLSKTKRTRAAKFASILYTGKSVKDVLRGKGKWVNLQAVIDPNGNVTLTRNIFRYRPGNPSSALSIGDIMSIRNSSGWETLPL